MALLPDQLTFHIYLLILGNQQLHACLQLKHNFSIADVKKKKKNQRKVDYLWKESTYHW